MNRLDLGGRRLGRWVIIALAALLMIPVAVVTSLAAPGVVDKVTLTLSPTSIHFYADDVFVRQPIRRQETSARGSA